MTTLQIGICVIMAFAAGLVIGIFIGKPSKYAKQKERLDRERAELIDSL